MSVPQAAARATLASCMYTEISNPPCRLPSTVSVSLVVSCCAVPCTGLTSHSWQGRVLPVCMFIGTSTNTAPPAKTVINPHFFRQCLQTCSPHPAQRACGWQASSFLVHHSSMPQHMALSCCVQLVQCRVFGRTQGRHAPLHHRRGRGHRRAHLSALLKLLRCGVCCFYPISSEYL